MNLRKALVVVLMAAALTAARPIRADEPICGLLVFYQQDADVTVYRAVHYGAVDVVTREDNVVFVMRVLMDPDDLVPLKPNQEFSCVS